jgi:hypothetical protein
MSRNFTLAEAEGLLPAVEKALREAIALKAEFEEAQSKVQSITQRVIMLGGVLVDRQAVYQNKLLLDTSAERLKSAINKIQELGCIVKDLDIGLVDFPALYRGEEVFLCWKVGEPGIGFWHGIREGFAGRKPIDEEFRRLHRGDAAN